MAKFKNVKVDSKRFAMVKVQKQLYRTTHIQNVPANEVEAVILSAQRDPNYVYSRQFPEGDGEYTVVIIYFR